MLCLVVWESHWVYIYIYIFCEVFFFFFVHNYMISVPDIGLAVRVFANGAGDQGSIPGRVIPKTQKIVLDASLLNTQHYKVRNKGKVEQSREGVALSPTLRCSSYRKGSLRVTLDFGHQIYLLIWYQVILSNTDNLKTVLWFQVFLSNTNNYIVSSKYFYLLIVVFCPHLNIFKLLIKIIHKNKYSSQ